MRDRKQFVYDRVPDDRMDQYSTWRQFDRKRDKLITNSRFPELSKAREDFMTL